jgi:nicotinamide-nucleotide amidase
MIAEIINIGDELLIGQVINTNAAWMAEQLSLAGFRTDQVTVVRDNADHILEALAGAERRAAIVLLSGGIGPTLDDITKHTLCDFFNTRLVFDEAAYRDVERLFARRGMPVTALNRMQAELPENCTAIPNRLGTARGMWFEKERSGGGKTIFVSMPGVPYEMKEMMTSHIIPRLQAIFRPPYIRHRTLLTQGIGESFLAALIEPWEKALPGDIRLAYLPQPGIVRLRLSGEGGEEKIIRKRIDEQLAGLERLIPEYFYGYDDDTMERVVGRLLQERGATLATAESCTGGAIARMITGVPGCSAWFKGSVVAYANDIKEKTLGVRSLTLAAHGAVSEEAVREMVAGVKERFGADYAIATSGIAGPDGGTPEKPVGTAWIAIAAPDGISARHYIFGEGRENNIRRTSLQALSLLRKKLLGGLK